MPLIPDTARRHLEPELMDDPALSADAHRLALRGLARINSVSRSAGLIWSALRDRLGAGTKPFRVLDVACGGGDVAVTLCRLARNAGVSLRADGCDISETALDASRTLAKRFGVKGDFTRLDALLDPLPDDYDAVVSNLFLHHLPDEEAVRLLQRMTGVAPVGVVNDLARGAAGYAGAYLGTRLLSRSHVVHVDGPRSVRAAFTVPEARALAFRAGLAEARVRRAFPWRWVLDWGPS